MPDIVVMYGGLSIVRVPWADRKTLPTTAVLAIAILHPDPRNLGKRRQAVIEFDHYVLAWTDTESYLGGYDDDFTWFSLTEPWKSSPQGFIHRFPYVMPTNSMLFEGAMVSPEQYAKALAIFGDREGPMY